MLVSLAYVAFIASAGVGLTYFMSSRLQFEERLAIGAVVGALALALATFVTFELFGMGWPAVISGALVPGGAAALAFVRHRREARAELARAGQRLRLPSRHRRSLRPFAALSLASLAVSTRILSLSYQATDRGISAGSLAIWGDWSAHLAYAGSFAFGDNRSLDLPTAAGQGFRYHFLADFFGAMFTVTGATLPQGLAISAWMLAAALPPLVWCAVHRLTGSRATAAVTLLLFTLSGGVGLWYFARDVDRLGWHIVTSLPQTYARIPDQHLWVDNTISASLYAQRSTLFGLCIGFAALILILVSRPGWQRRGFAAAGLMIAPMGITHAHMLLTALAFGGLAFVFDRRRVWLWFLVPAAAGLSLAWLIRPQTNSVRWLLGWMAPAADQPWPWFWFRNVGLLLPLFAGLSLLGGVPRRLRRLTAPLWLWFVIPNLIAFHPSEWNNTKYFLFWQFGGFILIAHWLTRPFVARRDERRPTLATYGAQGAAVIAFLLMISAGGLDTVRAMQRSTAIPWVDRDDVAAAGWLREHSEPEDVIVYGMSNTSAVAALGGRRAVSGRIGWTYDLGVRDWVARWSATQVILAGDPGVQETVARYSVDYVVIGPLERREYRAADGYWATHGTEVYRRGEYAIYAVD